MKIYRLAVTLASFFLVVVTSCRKEELSETKTAPGEAALSQYLFNSIKDEVDQEISRLAVLNGLISEENGDRNGCVTASINPLGNIFPKTVTLTYPDGCTTIAGATIKGNIQLIISGRVRENGTTVTFNLNKFEYKDHHISGEYKIIFTGPFSHRTEIKNGLISTPDNRIIKFNSINTASQIDGKETTFRTHPLTFLFDDAYQITTTSWGTNSKGTDFTINTVTPLEYKILCQWITSGVLSISEQLNPIFTVVIDYGDGNCDNKAMMRFNDREILIQLP